MQQLHDKMQKSQDGTGLLHAGRGSSSMHGNSMGTVPRIWKVFILEYSQIVANNQYYQQKYQNQNLQYMHEKIPTQPGARWVFRGFLSRVLRVLWVFWVFLKLAKKLRKIMCQKRMVLAIFYAYFYFQKLILKLLGTFWKRWQKQVFHRNQKKLKKNHGKLRYFTDFDNNLYPVYNKFHFKQ